MKEEEKKTNMQKIVELKKQLLLLRIKVSSGESNLAKEIKKIKKEIARIFTLINKK